jgi:hypothetical protein
VIEMFAGIELVDNPAPAEWLRKRLRRWPDRDGGVRVWSIVPEGFESYVRILHPAMERVPWDAGPPGRLRWRDVAESKGKIFHPEVEWIRLVGEAAFERRDGPIPDNGRLPLDETAALADVLARFTATPERCWFCIWSGYGYIENAPPQWDPSLVQLPDREYMLHRGPIEAVTTFVSEPWPYQSPNIWWPEDRGWVVASEIDLMGTYVAGSRACIEAILASDALEALETRADARVDSEADRLNPPS